MKAETQGIQSLTEAEKQQFRALMGRLEKVLDVPLGESASRTLRTWSRADYFERYNPQLAAVYQRLGAATFGPFAIHGPGQNEGDLIPKNEWVREENEIYFHAPLIFGKEPGFSLYYGTVPRLADSRGLQPVVYISAHGVPQFAIPIASSVDRFFDVYSRYLERMVVDFEYIETGISLINFPWGVADLIRHDEPLVAQVRAGGFDFLTNEYAGALKWLSELLSPPSSSS